MTTMLSQIKSLVSAFRYLYSFSPSGVIVNLVLMLLQGATAGIGILLLIPMLGFIGLEDSTMPDIQFTESLESALGFLGINLSLMTVLVVYVSILSLVAFVQYSLTVQVSKIQQRIICYFRELLHFALLKSNWQFITENKLSKFGHTLTLQIQSMGNVFQQLLLLISQMLMIFVYVTLAILLSWEISLLAVLFAAALVLPIIPFNHKIHQAGKKRLLGFSDIFQIIGEQLDSIKTIKTFNAEYFFHKKLKVANQKLEKQVVLASSANALSKLMFTIASVVFISAIFYVSLVWLEVAVSTLLLVLFIFSRLLPSIATLINTLHLLLFELPSIEDVRETIKTFRVNEQIDFSASKLKAFDSSEHDGVIEFKNVVYRYPGKALNAIDNLSFKIAINQTTVFFGPSGSGKTTTADLLVGLLMPTAGKVVINNQHLNPELLMSWRHNVAYVTQENHLFHQSIRDNLNWVSEGITEHEIWLALEQASAKDFVERLPDGLDSIIGDKGVRISGGERQRLALARALLKKPKLLVLDEATSALDKVNEQKIQSALARLKGKLTIIIIAHRDSSIRNADQVVYFGDSSDEQKISKISSINVY
ncbi:ABC transporter ATP-binding protein [Aliikangiella coralliicola]|uniref:ABC transporter ATP-binding protein n=1 Tax=Aliikangiella coralliicola TaxID=2592383 RepID=A0A545UJ71_9GAMM|nr:ABC transporter ATP-binding protein [Aliikangiella coralliicola]TQV89509.1 ABC transporter ATP-binding protein [Aliikangiella coralliicola]